MRARKDQRGLRTLAQAEALACRGGGKPVLPDLLITIPPPPVPPIILPLPDGEALACVGGEGDGNMIQLLIDWTIGTQPAPPQLPPTHI